MKIVVVTDKATESEILEKPASDKLTLVDSIQEAIAFVNPDAVIILTNDYSIADLQNFTSQTVLIHCVAHTLAELNLPPNFLRINGWATFIRRDNWELAGEVDRARILFDYLGWKYTPVADTPGLIAGRVVAMVINEAFYALGEGVSTEGEINTAMKLGTNYPYGPFEWAEKIGIANILHLLNKLSLNNKLYDPAPLMQSVLTKQYDRS